MLTNSITSALSGLNTFEQKIYESAQNISNYSSILPDPNKTPVNEKTQEVSGEANEISNIYFSKKPAPDLTSDIVSMVIAEHGYKANLNVLKTAEDMSKGVIDIFS